jgi:hypothetical protein
MKKIYYIGRDEYHSDIFLYDDTISRNHAILRVGKRGKYTIFDQSMNGTYVNGIRIASGVEVPVCRTDIISFAHVADLDWSLIPNTQKRNRVIILSIIAGLILVGAIGYYVYTYIKDKSSSPIEKTALEDSAYTMKDNAKSSNLDATSADDRELDIDNNSDVNKKLEDTENSDVKKKTQDKNNSNVKAIDDSKHESMKKNSNVVKEENIIATEESVEPVKDKKNINAIL